MNRRMVFYTVGLIILLEAGFFLLPLLVGLLDRSPSVFAFLISIFIALIFGLGLILFSRPKNKTLYAREGFVITSFAWLSLSAIGALPFFLSGQIPHYIDAFFETVSGFTTTGASILTNVEGLDRALLFWRSFTHWVGGMGVLVFLTAFLSNLSDHSIHILRAEMPGPTVGKLMPRTKDTAKILYLIYVGLTLLQLFCLLFTGMGLFESFIHTFGTAGTGGFGMFSDSIASLSPSQQWIITIFMLIFGVNFNLYYIILLRRFRLAFRSTELWYYLCITAAAIGIITVDLSSQFQGFSDALRHSAVQVSSVITTTGFTTLDWNSFSSLSKSVLICLMCLGACAGSTAGGLKISRFILLIKNCAAEFRHMLHPRSVNTIRFEGKKVDKETKKSVSVYFTLYIFCIVLLAFFLSLDSFDLETNLTAAISCFNNIGPAFGRAFASYAEYSPLSKFLLSLGMLLGRLEIWPILLTLSHTTWQSKQS